MIVKNKIKTLTQTLGYNERLIKITGYPKTIIPTHWDNFRLPYGISQENSIELKLLPFKEDVEKLKGTFNIEYTLSKSQSEKLWNLLNTEIYVNTLGSLSGNQAVQHAKAGLKAIYLSGWQVAADANSAGEMYPDQSLYPYDLSLIHI